MRGPYAEFPRLSIAVAKIGNTRNDVRETASNPNVSRNDYRYRYGWVQVGARNTPYDDDS